MQTERSDFMGYRKVGTYSYRFECCINGKKYSKNFRIYDPQRGEIDMMFTKWKASCDTGVYTNTRMTYGQLADTWINNICKPTYSPIVVKNYERVLNTWILPEFAKVPLCEITSLAVTKFLEKLKMSKTKYANRENNLLSKGTVLKIYEVFRDVIKLAYRNDIIDRDPCSKVKLEFKKEITELDKIHAWDIQDYNRALSLLSVEDKKNTLVIETALKTGLRRSELFGLTWEDLGENYIIVNKTRQKVKGKMIVLPCKTQSSVRKISIPDSLNQKLRRHHAEHMETKFIFEGVDYDAVTAWFREWVARVGLPKIRFHDLRHTHATLLLSQGIDIKTISSRLGHANISTTLNTYTHVLDELDQKASDVIENISQSIAFN